VRGLERLMIGSLAAYGVDAEVIDGLTGVWVGGEPRRGARSARSACTSAAGDHPRIRPQRQQRPAAVRMGRPCGIEGVRMTSLCRELGSEVDMEAYMDVVAEGFGEIYRRILSRPSSTRWASWSENPPRYGRNDAEQLHVTRSRANPGGRAADSEGKVPFRSRKPPWLKVPAPGGPTYRRLQKAIESDNLHTVCQEANCPNVGECWERGTATFMILGDVCTRRCGFCNVQTGKPTWHDPLEPLRVANQVKRMGLRHAVITSVDRDDLPTTVRAPSSGDPVDPANGARLQSRGPDPRLPRAGDASRQVIAERPDVFNHNVETVPRLYPVARRGSEFMRSAGSCGWRRRWAATRSSPSPG